MTFPLRFGVVTAQHQRDWAYLVDAWQMVEEFGFDTAWLFDHFVALYADPSGPCLEGWTLLAGLAARTSRLRLGVLVTGNTYRNPAILAKEATTVDHISGGRLEFGLGAAWYQPEHAALGIPFPSPGERVSRLGEALEVIQRLWTEDRPTFAGRYYHLNGPYFAPRPLQRPHPPIVVGGHRDRMLRLIGRFADNWNSFGPPEQMAQRGEVVRAAARAAGRDPDTIRWSLSTGGDPLESVDLFERTVESYVAVGVRDFMMDLPEPRFYPVVGRIAREVIPRLRTRHPAE